MVKGASMLTKRKNGRRRRASRTSSSQMFVVTQRSCQFAVTKSTSWSISEKQCSSGVPSPGKSSTLTSVPFDQARSKSATRSFFLSRSGWKRWCWIKNSATAFLPAQIPSRCSRGYYLRDQHWMTGTYSPPQMPISILALSLRACPFPTSALPCTVVLYCTVSYTFATGDE